MPVADALLKLLRCPQTHAPLVNRADWLISTDAASRFAYPVKDGVPLLLKAEAMQLQPQVWQTMMQS
ncbi:MAG: hypothetical protein IAF08_05730 [Rhizobacter sp.]|nr:hypothetical protein [Chlorobiales bacterium]